MKVAVTAQGKELSSQLDPRFGRAQWILLVDTETGECTAHDNVQNFNSPSGAGIQSGNTVAKLGAEAVITGNVGPNAFRTLQAGKIKVYLAKPSTVREAVEQLKNGELDAIQSPNVEGHWA